MNDNSDFNLLNVDEEQDKEIDKYFNSIKKEEEVNILVEENKVKNFIKILNDKFLNKNNVKLYLKDSNIVNELNGEIIFSLK
jgi:hypothetical protein